MNRPPNSLNGAAYDVVIVGGGMVGSMLACALGDSPLKVAVVERQPPVKATAVEDYDVRVSALTLASRAMFEALGVWPGIAHRRFGKVGAMYVWDAGGAGEIRFDAAEIGEPHLAFIVENSVVVAALQERVHQYTNVHWLSGNIGDIERGAEGCVVEMGERAIRTRLLAAADGADSAVRERLHIPVRSLDLRQQGIVATVRTEHPHGDVAWQKFLPSGPLAFLPLADPHTSSIVWSVDNARAQELLSLGDQAFSAALAQAFDNRLGAIPRVSARAAFPLVLAHAERYVEERVALIGDAAHTVHPLAGQGVNLGFLDAAVLAEVLRTAIEERRDIGSLHVLRRYERRRKGDNLAMVAVTGGFKFLFGNDWPLVTALRDMGLSATNRTAPLKSAIMRRACGLTGDLPRLARRSSTSASNLF